MILSTKYISNINICISYSKKKKQARRPDMGFFWSRYCSLLMFSYGS
jgi:hypothetical protein